MTDDPTGAPEPDRRAVLVLDARGLHLEPADATDHDHDAAADLPWDDDAPLPPYPVIATDPDPGAPMPTFPGLPVSARWPDPSEELAGLREFRADYDRLMSTEGQSHGEAIAALSGLVVSARQRPAPGPHIPPALMRRVEALGFVPGSGEPVGWLLGYVEGLAALLTTAQGERDELAATLANERGEGEPPCAGYMSVCEAERPDEDNPDEDIVVRWRGAWDGECDVYVGTSGEDHLWWWSVMGRTTEDRLVMLAYGRAPTARAAMIAADAARSAGGGAS